MQLSLRPALPTDAPLLGEMNRQMADDEHSRNPLTAAELTARMQRWLADKQSRIVILEEAGQIAGYVVFQIESDYYDPTIPEVYIRQFFIRREHRRRGLGREAFRLLQTEHLPPRSQIHLDVLVANPIGQRFWAALGFVAYATTMRRIPAE